MAVSIPIVTEFVNDGIKKAERAFGDIKKAVGEAEGTMGKFKAGGKAAFDALSANAGAFAISASIAVGKFAFDGAKAFTDLATSAGKFSDATGIAVDQASRLMEVTGDIGIDAGTLETAIGKMNQNLGKSPDLFQKLGVQVAYANDGTVDANGTFLNVIDRLSKIKDPAEKARIATQLLGKGWRDMAELINMGSDKLQASLDDVSDAKVIDPKELEKAKKFRETMDDFSDTLDDIKLTLGESVIPLLEDFANTAKGIKDLDFGSLTSGLYGIWQQATVVDDIFRGLKGGVEAGVSWVSSWFRDDGAPAVEVFAGAMRESRDDTDKFKESIKDFRRPEITKPVDEFAKRLNQTATEIKNIDQAWSILTGKLDARVAFDNAITTLGELEAAAAQAFATGSDSDIAKFNAVAAESAGQIAALAQGLDNISSRDIKIKFQAEGNAAALALYAYFKGGAELKGLTANQLIGQSGFSFGVPGRASGGSVTAGGTYLVGERGPELLTMGASSGYISPSGAGSTINVTVTSADPNQVVAAIQQWTRNNGAIPLTTTTNVRR